MLVNVVVAKNSKIVIWIKIMLSSKDLINAGIKPGPLFGQILKSCLTIEEALGIWEEQQPQKEHKTNKVINGSAWEFLINNPCLKGIPSLEFSGTVASNSEKRRWLEQGAIIINGIKVKPDDIIFFPLTELVFFHNSTKHKVTMI